MGELASSWQTFRMSAIVCNVVLLVGETGEQKLRAVRSVEGTKLGKKMHRINALSKRIHEMGGQQHTSHKNLTNMSTLESDGSDQDKT